MTEKTTGARHSTLMVTSGLAASHWDPRPHTNAAERAIFSPTLKNWMRDEVRAKAYDDVEQTANNLLIGPCLKFYDNRFDRLCRQQLAKHDAKVGAGKKMLATAKSRLLECLKIPTRRSTA